MAAGSLLMLIDKIALVLDDVAVMTKVAAKKTAGVLGDDLAVNAEKLSTGIRAERELPVVWAVFKGSLVNKAILVPVALLLNYFLPIVITPLLMIGGAYLCYEGAEKIWHAFSAKHKKIQQQNLLMHHQESVNLLELEKSTIKGAIFSDFILSAELIVIALGIIREQPLLMQVIVLTVIALMMTIGVYGLVAAIVKIDDAGLALMKEQSTSFIGHSKRKLGQFMLSFAPKFMRFLAVAGTVAMFLVGAGIITHGMTILTDLLHQLEHIAETLSWGGPWLVGLTPLLFNFITGLLIGACLVFTHFVVGKLIYLLKIPKQQG